MPLKKRLAIAMCYYFSLQSASAMSSERPSSKRSSRKRKRELYWSELLKDTDINISDNQSFITPDSFVDLNKEQRDTFLNFIGLSEDQKTTLMVKVMEAKSIPSPSSMKWADVKSILDGSIPEISDFEELADDDTTTISITLSSMVTMLKNNFRRVSEMEVVVRVFSLLLCVISEKEITVELQPSFSGSTVFTDFLIKLTNGNCNIGFIKVKRTDLSVDLDSKTETTAQALREAQILLCNDVNPNPLPFVVTNGKHWSYGLAKKSGASRITLISIHNLFCEIDTVRGWKKAMKYLKAFINGNWPPAAAAAP